MFVLVYQPPHQKQLNRYDTMPERTMCVQRNGTTMLLDYCTSTTTTVAGGGAANSATTTRGKEGTRFTLVRYNSGFQQQPQHYHHYQHQHDTMEDQTLPGIPKETASTATTTTSVAAATTATTTHIANTKDLAHSHASVPSKKPTSALLKPSNKKKPNPNNKSNNNRNPKRQTGQQSRNHLIHTLAPLTLESHHHHHHHYAEDDGLTQQTIMATKTTATTTTTTTFVKKTHDNNNNVAALNLRMLQPHPYIAAAKNGIYTDPQTGLQYPTDLCNYLGDSEKDAGRHTLMGVGQYTKTVFHIKVCFGRPCH
jgi:hypothetical protein